MVNALYLSTMACVCVFCLMVFVGVCDRTTDV